MKTTPNSLQLKFFITIVTSIALCNSLYPQITCDRSINWEIEKAVTYSIPESTEINEIEKGDLINMVNTLSIEKKSTCIKDLKFTFEKSYQWIENSGYKKPYNRVEKDENSTKLYWDNNLVSETFVSDSPSLSEEDYTADSIDLYLYGVFFDLLPLNDSMYNQFLSSGCTVTLYNADGNVLSSSFLGDTLEYSVSCGDNLLYIDPKANILSEYSFNGNQIVDSRTVIYKQINQYYLIPRIELETNYYYTKNGIRVKKNTSKIYREYIINDTSYIDATSQNSNYNMANSINQYNDRKTTLAKINFYPNPSEDILYTSSNINLLGNQYVIYNSNGKKIKEGVFQNKMINIQNLESGIYFIQIRIENNINYSKFIKN